MNRSTQEIESAANHHLLNAEHYAEMGGVFLPVALSEASKAVALYDLIGINGQNEASATAIMQAAFYAIRNEK